MKLDDSAPPVSRRSRPSIHDSTPPPTTRPPPPPEDEGFIKRTVAIGGVISLLCGTLGVGYGWRASQATVTAEGIKPVIEQLQRIDVRLNALEISAAKTSADVDWLKRTMASTPGTSTQMIVTAREGPRK